MQFARMLELCVLFVGTRILDFSTLLIPRYSLPLRCGDGICTFGAEIIQVARLAGAEADTRIAPSGGVPLDYPEINLVGVV